MVVLFKELGLVNSKLLKGLFRVLLHGLQIVDNARPNVANGTQ